MIRGLLASLFLLWAVSVEAAPAVIGTPVSGNSGNAATLTPLTISATCPSGSTNVIAVACFGSHKQTAVGVTLTSVTWAGVPMAAVGAAAIGSADSGSYAQLYTLNSPTCDGSQHDYVVTPNTTQIFMVGAILFLKDVNLTAPYDTQASATGVSTTPATVDVTSTTGDLVVDCVAARNSNTDLVVGAGQTNTAGVTQTTFGTASSNEEGGQSYEAGATTTTMSWTAGAASISWAIVGVSFNPVPTIRHHGAPRYYQ